jgi:hypothetical protein
LKNAFFIGGFYTSLMLFFQWFLHYYFSYDNFGTINYYMMRQACAFIFSDVSFLSLYLSLIAFYCFRVFFKKHNFIMLTYMLVITLGMLLSSARTGLFVLFVFIFIYVFFKQKNIINKVFLCLILLIFSYVFLQFFYTIRAESNLLSDSGRFQGYLRALSLLFDRPFIGYGFSRDYISSLMGCSIPHFSFLQYAIHGGILYSLVLLYNQYCIFKYAVVKKSFYVWQHAMILIGCCFIPDIFASRFLTMIILLIIIVTKRKINLLSLSYTKL